MTICAGWPAPHVPPVVLSDGDGPTSHGICDACAAVVRVLAAPASRRMARFRERMEYDRERMYLAGLAWSARDRQLRQERP